MFNLKRSDKICTGVCRLPLKIKGIKDRAYKVNIPKINWGIPVIAVLFTITTNIEIPIRNAG
jgi:hypothetical protein